MLTETAPPLTLAALLASSSASSLASAQSLAHSSPTTTGAMAASNPSSDTFPHWAIATICVLGGLLLLLSGAGAYLFLRNVRKRRADAESAHGRQRVSTADEKNALLAGGGGSRNVGHESSSVAERSTLDEGQSGGGLVSGSEAALMAQAFRKALRQPEFPKSGEPSPPEEVEAQDLMDRELATEGRSVRSVGDVRKPVQIDSKSAR